MPENRAYVKPELRIAEKAIVRALADAFPGSKQSQVTFAHRFEIATDDLIVSVEVNIVAEADAR